MSAPATFSGPALRQARAARGLTREQVAVSISRGGAQVALYERGHSVPPTPVVGSLADALDVSVEDPFARPGGRTARAAR